MKEFTDEEIAMAAEMARQDFYFFSRWMFLNTKGFKWMHNWHHKIICDALTDVVNGKIKRLIINIPPRYSKTELAVVNFMAWCLGHFPDSEFIHASYSSALANENSYKCREMILSQAYQNVFPFTKVRDDSKAKNHWKTSSGGVVYAAGTEGTITGFGAGKKRKEFGGCIIIDDPHKASEATSDVIRNNVLNWFQTTLESRKNDPKETPIIVIMQRLHEVDLAGWLLDGGNGEEWTHINIPVLDGDTPLWPEMHSLEELRRMEKANPYMFSGQYMQSPSPDGGGAFKPEQLKIVDVLPEGRIEWVRGWDLASSTSGDFTVGGKIGRLSDGRYVIADILRIKATPDERDHAIVNTTALDGIGCKVSIPQDPGQAGKTQVAYLTRELAGYRVISSPESGNKEIRAEPLAAQINVGNVMMLRAEWNANLVHEMRMFPNGRNDDQVDALSRAFSELVKSSGGIKISPDAVRKAKMLSRFRR